jgi:hypothetical protein
MAALLALAVALIAWNWPHLKAQAAAGSAYGARIGCSCRYVQGRGMESCREDMEPGMAMVQLDDDPAEKAVTGSVPLMAQRTARLKPGFGCVLDRAPG